MIVNRLRSPMEVFIDDVLTDLDIPHEFESTRFPVEVDGRRITYTPDFVLSLKFGEKTILIEDHGVVGPDGNQFDDDFFDKMNAFRHSQFKDQYYLIFITDIEKGRLGDLLHNRGSLLSNMCDEIWFDVGGTKNKHSEGNEREELKDRTAVKLFGNKQMLMTFLEKLKVRSVSQRH